MSNKLAKSMIAAERGARVRFIRVRIVAMTGQDFARQCGLTRGTITNWETGKGKTGLTKKGATQIIQAINAIGIACSVEWLLHGAGIPPKIVDQNKLARLHYPSGYTNKLNHINEPSTYNSRGFGEEVALFKKRYPMHLLHTIQDESMAPLYHMNDCVGGPRLAPEQFKFAQSKICIILLQPDQILVRRVRVEGAQVETMSFYVLNAEAALEYPPLSHVPIASVIALAPITRLWRSILEDSP
jgi:transcriptional regulator with XRE-family HTH domain